MGLRSWIARALLPWTHFVGHPSVFSCWGDDGGFYSIRPVIARVGRIGTGAETANIGKSAWTGRASAFARTGIREALATKSGVQKGNFMLRLCCSRFPRIHGGLSSSLSGHQA